MATCGSAQGYSKRDRSLVTVSALIAMNRPDQLRSHLARARENGLTERESVEAITIVTAFYAGWPNAVTAVSRRPRVFKLRQSEQRWLRINRVRSRAESQAIPRATFWRDL